MKLSNVMAGAVALSIALSPVAAFAQATPAAPAPCPDGSTTLPCKLGTKINDAAGIVDLINTAANWMFTILLLMAVMFYLWAGYKYLTSEGSSEKVDEVHRLVVYASVAVAVGILSRGLVYVIGKLVG